MIRSKGMEKELKNSSSEEDYLEAVLVISEKNGLVHRIDVARQLDVSGAAVNKAVNLLIEHGYVLEDGKHLILTENGRTYASRIYERHLILKDFLMKLGVSEKTAEQDACKVEHAISEETFEKIKENL